MDNILSPADIAKRLKCTTQWITELLRTGKLKGTKFGRQWVITLADLEEFLKDQRQAKAKAKAKARKEAEKQSISDVIDEMFPKDNETK